MKKYERTYVYVGNDCVECFGYFGYFWLHCHVFKWSVEEKRKICVLYTIGFLFCV